MIGYITMFGLWLP